MAISNSIENFMPVTNDLFVKKANELRPSLNRINHEPVALVDVYMGKEDWECTKVGRISDLKEMELNKGNSICLDFGDHQVGYVSFDIMSAGAPADAPAFLRLKFGEHLCEIGEDNSTYHGGISSSWIQEELIHIDVIPSRVTLPRRYAFRYMEFYVKDTSPNYKIKIDNVLCDSVSSADISVVMPLEIDDKLLEKIDKVSLKTMQDCMQDVFEDGPKRDRRLWIGDLRLQALTNYETFKNYNLVKRCMYLFAGLMQNEYRVGACLYIEPTAAVSDVSLFDYSLFFISCLYDYYNKTKDLDLLKELYPTAKRQAELAKERIDEKGLVRDSDDWWCFLDWHDELNKQAGAQAVFIYTLKQLAKIEEVLNIKPDETNNLIDKLSDASVKYLWDEEKGFFTSGKNKQISWVSQIWFVLAEVFNKEKNAKLLKHLVKVNPSIGMVTPYAYHHYIDALIKCDMKNEALENIKSYWGAMVEDGADCFFELYDPKNKKVSPYGSRIINSYCHAWSGTPSYFIRKYFIKK